LLELTADGGFADLGCGTGVLAVLAAKLGWHPVTAIDIQPGSVEAARVNAEQNGVRIEARVADLAVEPAPPARAFAANVPTVLHRRLAGGLAAPPRTGLLSGFGASEADDVVTAYAGAGLEERRRIDVHGWTVLVMGG
jgi:ribosomal protein L11 methyltransferase